MHWVSRPVHVKFWQIFYAHYNQNPKPAHSIVLMAVCNARYEFILVDIRDSGRQSNGSVYRVTVILAMPLKMIN